MERPKRTVAKPARYQTTSSEDEAVRRPSNRAPNSSTITDAEIDDDIGDLRTTLEDPSTNMNKTTNYNIYSQSQQSQQQSSQQAYSPQIASNISSHTYIQSTSTTYPTLPTISHTYPCNYDNNINSNSVIPISTRADGVIFNTNTHGNQFQVNRRSCWSSHQDPIDARSSGPVQNNYQDNTETQTNEKSDRSINLLHERMDRMEAEFKRTNTVIQSILKCVQDHRGVPRKPAVLPVSSLAEMDDFENIDKNRFTEVVS
ncbi:PREDICTED: uncharacterized protein LOC105455208 [Wasmannia auropunctata]|uniref:uncharacterized protein LOC105455208 n=1 Tax=Wasmannia auropunctata TaxID=64793 RepID=UPI0005EF6618|nr:PREDICTED: uncharacterized protein LOC105455208 [Wasmannia auropunctata]